MAEWKKVIVSGSDASLADVDLHQVRLQEMVQE